jgi:hypothetical protein
MASLSGGSAGVLTAVPARNCLSACSCRCHVAPLRALAKHGL